jgi:hypothetical protein
VATSRIDQPGGSINQPFTNSGFVKAWKTSRRGAFNSRVIRISRAPRAASFKPSRFFICRLLYRFVRALLFSLVFSSSSNVSQALDCFRNVR